MHGSTNKLIRQKVKKLEGQKEYTLQPSNFQFRVQLVNKTLLVSADTFAELIIRPALIDKHDRDED